MTTVLFLGHHLRPLDSVTRVGDALGLKRATAYNRCHEWPLDGEPGQYRVIVPALAVKLGIPYEIIPEEES